MQNAAFTVSTLGTGAFTGQIKVITDGNPNCATGAGSTVLFCRWNGTSWDTLSEPTGSGAPGGTNTQVQFNNSGAFGGISNGVAGQALISNGPSTTPSFQDPIVSGPDATGAVATKNPVQTGGIDYGTGCGVSQPCVRELKVDSNGNIYVANFPATQPVSGTVTANIGTTNGLALDTSVNGILNSQGSTTSGQKGPLVQGAVTTSAPTYTTAQTDPLSLNTSGGLRVDGSGVTQPVNGTVTANAGTGTFNIQSNASVNVAQVGGSSTSTAATGVQKVGIVGNAGAAVDAATGAAPPANTVYVGGLQSGATGGLLGGITVCDKDVSVNISTATTTLEVTGVSGRQVRICAINLVAGAADNVALIEGTGATCGTGTAGMAGGTTAASGWNFGANGGLTQGSGLGEIMTTATAGDSVCLATSAAVQLSGHIKYTIY